MSQIGFLPTAPKIAVVVGASRSDVRRRRRRARRHRAARHALRTEDVGALRRGGHPARRLHARSREPGRYRLVVPGAGDAGGVRDRHDAHPRRSRARRSRASTISAAAIPIEARYAGQVGARRRDIPTPRCSCIRRRRSASRPAGTTHLVAARLVRRGRLQQVRRQLGDQHVHAAAPRRAVSRSTRRRCAPTSRRAATRSPTCSTKRCSTSAGC